MLAATALSCFRTTLKLEWCHCRKRCHCPRKGNAITRMSHSGAGSRTRPNLRVFLWAQAKESACRPRSRPADPREQLGANWSEDQRCHPGQQGAAKGPPGGIFAGVTHRSSLPLRTTGKAPLSSSYTTVTQFQVYNLQFQGPQNPWNVPKDRCGQRFVLMVVFSSRW